MEGVNLSNFLCISSLGAWLFCKLPINIFLHIFLLGYFSFLYQLVSRLYMSILAFYFTMLLQIFFQLYCLDLEFMYDSFCSTKVLNFHIAKSIFCFMFLCLLVEGLHTFLGYTHTPLAFLLTVY